MKQLIDINTLSETLAIPKGSIRNALWRGQGGINIPNPIRIGRCLRWDTESVDQWIAGKSTEPSSTRRKRWRKPDALPARPSSLSGKPGAET
ncbi:MAG: helix-turn-helix transcriptional regulator [Gammaproteobacteria bacterium]